MWVTEDLALVYVTECSACFSPRVLNSGFTFRLHFCSRNRCGLVCSLESHDSLGRNSDGCVPALETAISLVRGVIWALSPAHRRAWGPQYEGWFSLSPMGKSLPGGVVGLEGAAGYDGGAVSPWEVVQGLHTEAASVRPLSNLTDLLEAVPCGCNEHDILCMYAFILALCGLLLMCVPRGNRCECLLLLMCCC